MGRRPYISSRTGPEGLLGSRQQAEVPQDCVALSVDGSHIGVERHMPLHCHLINLGGCAITYGRTSAATCSASPPWPRRTPISTCVLATARVARR